MIGLRGMQGEFDEKKEAMTKVTAYFDFYESLIDKRVIRVCSF